MPRSRCSRRSSRRCSAARRTELERELAARLREIDDDREFLRRANIGGECMKRRGHRARAGRSRASTAGATPTGNGADFLTEDEVENLTIRAGTLTADERQIINHHIE